MGPKYDIAQEPVLPSPLGDPLTINEVARLIGCSVWTIRQRCIPSGLPCFRLGQTGKLIFYRNQILSWILTQQEKKQKGGQGSGPLPSQWRIP